jgi:hypothetical protein
MLGIVSARRHGVIDYALILAFLVAPSLGQFSVLPAALAYSSALIYAAGCFMTQYPLGCMKRMPFASHGLWEVVMACLWILAPWYLGFSHEVSPANFFVLSGIALLLVAAITDYRHPARNP